MWSLNETFFLNEDILVRFCCMHCQFFVLMFMICTMSEVPCMFGVRCPRIGATGFSPVVREL